MNGNKFLCNAFSLQMVEPANIGRVRFEIIDKPSQQELKAMTSAIGHADLAAVLGTTMNRVNVKLTDEVELIVAQLTGGRLPEGATKLPEGFVFQWIRVYLA